MTKLIITRGLPGSGKSTRARLWVSEDPKHRAEINRDQLRVMMHGGYADAETQITIVRDAAIRYLLNRGVDVVCSDTNLPQRTARDLAKIARLAGAEVEIWDMTDIHPLECLERNAKRMDKDPVPEATIWRMHSRFIVGKSYPLPLPVEDETVSSADFVEWVDGLPRAVIVDIDGTVALKGARSPYDYTRVYEDLPNQRVIDAVIAMWLAGYKVVFVSGRSEDCRAMTEEWLAECLPFRVRHLFMRASGDMRKDSIVKRELFDKNIRGAFNVVCVFDDRDQVVKMWRHELGLTCLQVAEGAF